MALKDLEKNLYSSNPDKIRQIRKSPKELDLREQKTEAKEEIPEAWQEESQEEKERGMFFEFLLRFSQISRWLFWFLVVISVIIIAVGAYYFYQYTKSRDLTLTLNAPSSVLIGVPFDIEVGFTNNSDRAAQGARLSMALPKDVFSANDHPKRTLTQDFGDVAPRQSVNAKMSVVIFGPSDTIERFEAGVSYYPPSLGAKVRFEKTRAVDVAVRGPGIKLDMSAPQKVLSGESLLVKVNYSNNSEIKFPHAQIELSFPSSFSFRGATPSPTVSNNIWTIDNLDKGASGEIDIQGNVLAPEQSFFDIKSSVKTDNNIIDQKTATLTVAPSPLSLAISLNNQTNYIAHLGDDLHYFITYKNNSDVDLNDAVIKVKLNGDMFDFLSLRSNGAFSSIDNSITWNASNITDLRSIAPGAGGTVAFNLKAKISYPVRRLADKNFILTADAQISSPAVPYYVSADKTISVSHTEARVAGQAAIKSLAYFNDPTGQIKNHGPIPPRVNTPTSYVIDWQIINYSTDLDNIRVKSTLPPGVKFTGNVKSNVSSVPVFNESTSEINWNIDRIVANKGVLGKPVEVVFQIEATPNVTQVNQQMQLLNETDLSAVDEFTSSTLTSAAPGLTTQLTNDPGVNNQGQWTVEP